MVDLWFADNTAKNSFNCDLCRKNPNTAKERRCQEPGFENLKKPRKVDDSSGAYSFCAGKATWYDEIAELFVSCRTSMETGILPKSGALEDQDELFAEVFPHFVAKWKDRHYARIWVDVRDFTKTVLEAIFPKKK